MVKTRINKSRVCPSDQTTIADNDEVPWEYDNPQRNKADGCMSKGLTDVRSLWGEIENNEDCDLPNSEVWRDVAHRQDKSIFMGSGREGQILPEGKTFVFGSSSHPCDPSVAEGGCSGNWRHTQPWDENAGCSWGEWVKDGESWTTSRRDKCLSSVNGLEEGICPEGYGWSGSNDPDSWWSRDGPEHEHPLIKYAGSGWCGEDGMSCSNIQGKGSWNERDGELHDHIRFGIIPTNAFAAAAPGPAGENSLYWNEPTLGDEYGQPQTGKPPDFSDAFVDTPNMYDIRENCGNPDCSVIIGGNHIVRYKDGGLQHVNKGECQRGLGSPSDSSVRCWRADEMAHDWLAAFRDEYNSADKYKGYTDISYNPFGSLGPAALIQGPTLGLHSTNNEACQSETYVSDHTGMSMGTGTGNPKEHIYNPYWNTDWRGFYLPEDFESGNREEPTTCLPSWDSPATNPGNDIDNDFHIRDPFGRGNHGGIIVDAGSDDGGRTCGLLDQRGLNGAHQSPEASAGAAEDRGRNLVDCQQADRERNTCSGIPPRDSSDCLLAEESNCSSVFISGVEEEGSSAEEGISKWSNAGCGEKYINQYKHMISDDKDENFGSWSMYDQSYHIEGQTFLEEHTAEIAAAAGAVFGPLGIAGGYLLGEALSSDPVRKQGDYEMSHRKDKIVPKCFKLNDNYFKTDPINGVPLDSNFGIGDNPSRKYVYRDWNPLLIVLDLAQELSRHSDLNNIDINEIELRGKGWGINRDGLSVGEAGHEDSGAVTGERRDFCQGHVIGPGSNILDSHIFDHRSTWRWGFGKEYHEGIAQYIRDACLDDFKEKCGSETDPCGRNEDWLANPANIGTICSGLLRELVVDGQITTEWPVLNNPDKTLTLRDCVESGCVADGAAGADLNGCSYTKLMILPGDDFHHFDTPSMDNTTKLLPDLSNCPIRDENDNLLYVRQERTVLPVTSYSRTETPPGSPIVEIRPVPLFLNEEMVEELMMKYHKLLCCYGKLDWKLFSSLFCGFSPIFDRVIKTDSSISEKKSLDEQKCNMDDITECDGSSHNRLPSEELVTGGFNFNVKDLSIGSRVNPEDNINTGVYKTFDSHIPYITGIEADDTRGGQSVITEIDNITSIKEGIETGIYGHDNKKECAPACATTACSDTGTWEDDEAILHKETGCAGCIPQDPDTGSGCFPGASDYPTQREDSEKHRFPGLKLFSEEQCKYIKMAFDYLEGDDVLMNSGGDMSYSGQYENPGRDPSTQKRGAANISPGGCEGMNCYEKDSYTDNINSWSRSFHDRGTSTSILDIIENEEWFKNWDNIAKKQYCHEDYFKCDEVVYGEGSYNLDEKYPAFSEISDKCLSFINNDICPIPHRNSDGGGNRYCERLPISEQHALGGGPEGSSRLAPPGIKVPTSWDNIDIVDSSGSHKLSELINTGNALDSVILSNKEGYGKYCINPIDPQYYRSNICLDFCGNLGGEGGDASVITDDDQCINMIDNYCEDVFMGLKRGKTEYQLQNQDGELCSSHDDCSLTSSYPICYKEESEYIGKCGPWGIASTDWEWINSEPMLLDGESRTDSSYISRQNKRSDDEINMFEVIGKNSGNDRQTGRNSDPSIYDSTGGCGLRQRPCPEEIYEEKTVFKDGSYYIKDKSELFKTHYKSIGAGGWTDDSECSMWALSEDYCGKEKDIMVSPIKDTMVTGSIATQGGLSPLSPLDQRVPGQQNIIRDICIGHFPGYNITDFDGRFPNTESECEERGGTWSTFGACGSDGRCETPGQFCQEDICSTCNNWEDKNWLYRISETNDNVDFEEGLKEDLTMDKLLSNDILGFNKGDPNPNFNPKLGEDENFYRWVVNKGPTLEVLSDISGGRTTVSSSIDQDNSVIPDIYHRMKHHWKNINENSDIDTISNFGESDILDALSYDRDFARYLMHKYNRSQYDMYNHNLDLFEPKLGPHHLWGYDGINYEDFNYSDMSEIKLDKDDEGGNVIPREEIHHVGSDTGSVFNNYNIINRGVNGATLPCYDKSGNADGPNIWSCINYQPTVVNDKVNIRDATITQEIDCNIQTNSARPCDIYSCMQFQSISAIGGIDVSSEADIIQNMECTIGGDYIAPNFCPEDFDCSSSPNDLVDNPSSTVCLTSTCTIDDCCINSQNGGQDSSSSSSLSEEIDDLIEENKIAFILIIIIIIIFIISFIAYSSPTS